jgi:hypothetical protein
MMMPYSVEHMLKLLTATAAAAVLLGGPAVAGNLGAADHVMYGVDAKSPDYTKTSFKVHVGIRLGRGTDKSVASFESGRFRIITEPSLVEHLKGKGRIDANARLDESGILPAQVISFNYHVQAPFIVYSLLYRDTEGAVQLATWSFLWAEDDAKAFNSVFRSWMSKVQK